MTEDKKVSFAGTVLPGAETDGDFLEAGTRHVPVSGGGTGKVTLTTVTVDPRTEVDAQIACAFQIVIDASDDHTRLERRDYAPDELETLFFALGCALVKLRKLPGGVEARDRFYDRAQAELQVRGRRDILDELDAEAKIRRICDALDELGVPRQAPPGEPVSEGQPLDVESRVRQLGAERDRLHLRRPQERTRRRVQRVVTVKYADLTEAEQAHAHPTGTPGMWEVLRWEDSEAAKIVKRAFGDNVDLSDGTAGDALVKMIVAEEAHLDVLRDKLLALAATIREPGEGDPP